MPCPNVKKKKKKKKQTGWTSFTVGCFCRVETSSSYNRTVGKSSPPPSQHKKKNVLLSCITGKVLAPLALLISSSSVYCISLSLVINNFWCATYHGFFYSSMPADIRNYICNPGLKSFVCVCWQVVKLPTVHGVVPYAVITMSGTWTCGNTTRKSGRTLPQQPPLPTIVANDLFRSVKDNVKSLAWACLGYPRHALSPGCTGLIAGTQRCAAPRRQRRRQCSLVQKLHLKSTP